MYFYILNLFAHDITHDAHPFGIGHERLLKAFGYIHSGGSKKQKGGNPTKQQIDTKIENSSNVVIDSIVKDLTNTNSDYSLFFLRDNDRALRIYRRQIQKQDDETGLNDNFFNFQSEKIKTIILDNNQIKKLNDFTARDSDARYNTDYYLCYEQEKAYIGKIYIDGIVFEEDNIITQYLSGIFRKNVKLILNKDAEDNEDTSLIIEILIYNNSLNVTRRINNETQHTIRLDYDKVTQSNFSEIKKLKLENLANWQAKMSIENINKDEIITNYIEKYILLCSGVPELDTIYDTFMNSIVDMIFIESIETNLHTLNDISLQIIESISLIINNSEYNLQTVSLYKVIINILISKYLRNSEINIDQFVRKIEQIIHYIETYYLQNRGIINKNDDHLPLYYFLYSSLKKREFENSKSENGSETEYENYDSEYENYDSEYESYSDYGIADEAIVDEDESGYRTEDEENKDQYNTNWSPTRSPVKKKKKQAMNGGNPFKTDTQRYSNFYNEIIFKINDIPGGVRFRSGMKLNDNKYSSFLKLTSDNYGYIILVNHLNFELIDIDYEKLKVSLTEYFSLYKSNMITLNVTNDTIRRNNTNIFTPITPITSIILLDTNIDDEYYKKGIFQYIQSLIKCDGEGRSYKNILKQCKSGILTFLGLNGSDNDRIISHFTTQLFKTVYQSSSYLKSVKKFKLPKKFKTDILKFCDFELKIVEKVLYFYFVVLGFYRKEKYDFERVRERNEIIVRHYKLKLYEPNEYPELNIFKNFLVDFMKDLTIYFDTINFIKTFDTPKGIKLNSEQKNIGASVVCASVKSITTIMDNCLKENSTRINLKDSYYSKIRKTY